MESRRYAITIGPFEFQVSGDDRHARNVACRWTRRYFARRVAHLPAYSIAAHIAADDPTVIIRRFGYVARGVHLMSTSFVDGWAVRFNSDIR